MYEFKVTTSITSKYLVGCTALCVYQTYIGACGDIVHVNKLERIYKWKYNRVSYSTLYIHCAYEWWLHKGHCQMFINATHVNVKNLMIYFLKINIIFQFIIYSLGNNEGTLTLI